MYVLGTKDSSDSEQSRPRDYSAQCPLEPGYMHAVTVIYLQTMPGVSSWTVGTFKAESSYMLVGIPGGLGPALLIPRAEQMFTDNGVLASPMSSLPCDRDSSRQPLQLTYPKGMKQVPAVLASLTQRRF